MPPVPMATTSTATERARDDVTVVHSETPEPARWRLVFLSLLMFFVELALIRWTAANNVHLAYVTNFVLLASFLGIGVGFLLAGSTRELFRWAPVALARGSLSTDSQYSAGRGASGAAAEGPGLRAASAASFSICFGVGMRQLAGRSVIPN